MTFVTAGTLDMARGNLGDFLDWWVVLRSLIDGRARAHGRKLRASATAPARRSISHRSFGPDDDDADIAHFLAEAGFVHLRGWFDPDAMRDDLRRHGPRAPDVPAATTVARGGRRPPTEPTAACACSTSTSTRRRPSTCSTATRFARIGRLTDDGYAPRCVGNRIEALVKPIGVVEGISDVPWHKDCSLGMHSYNCCSLTVGISVTGADDRSGQLRVVAGSHRALVQPAFVRRESALPIVDLPTATGDATRALQLHAAHGATAGRRASAR